MEQILKDWQRKTLNFVASNSNLENFYLTGGTALAVYYLYHRYSDDLDFFSFIDFDPIFIHDAAKKIKEMIGASQVRFSRIFDRYQFFYLLNGEESKIEFTKYPFSQLELPQKINGIIIDSEYDMAVNKLAAALDRFDPKDFVDLYFLIPKFSLERIKNGVEKKFDMKVDALFLGSELSKARRIQALPNMIKSLTVNELKEFFINEIKKLSSSIIE